MTKKERAITSILERIQGDGNKMRQALRGISEPALTRIAAILFLLEIISDGQPIPRGTGWLEVATGIENGAAKKLKREMSGNHNNQEGTE